jgi:hypothetical protein
VRDAILQWLRRKPALHRGLGALRIATRRTVLRLTPYPRLGPVPAGAQRSDAAHFDAVVFSSYVPTRAALDVAAEFLALFEKRFADCDIYVGINTGSLPEWERMLIASTLRIRIGTVGPSLTVDSDVAGFQKALMLMRDEGREYDLVWFGHTKGATSNDPALRRRLVGDFYLKRKRITALFDHPRVGSFGHDISYSEVLPGIDARVDAAILAMPYPSIGVFYLHTFYVIRGSIIKRFLDSCSEDFFAKNIVSDLGFDRYFFEKEFSRLADRFGYYPLYRERHRNISVVPVTRAFVRGLYAAWEQHLPEDIRARWTWLP